MAHFGINLRFDLPLATPRPAGFCPGSSEASVCGPARPGGGRDRGEALRLYGGRAELVTVSLPAVEERAWRARRRRVGRDAAAIRGVLSCASVPPRGARGPGGALARHRNADLRLPLPRLIDVTLDPQAEPDLPALKRGGRGDRRAPRRPRGRVPRRAERTARRSAARSSHGVWIPAAAGDPGGLSSWSSRGMSLSPAPGNRRPVAAGWVPADDMWPGSSSSSALSTRCTAA